MREPIPTDPERSLLLCPSCNFDHVHIDEVFVGVKQTNPEPTKFIKVDSHGRTREVRVRGKVPIPDVGDRYVFALQGWCENCHSVFTLEFKQHKGHTQIAVRIPEWAAQ